YIPCLSRSHTCPSPRSHHRRAPPREKESNTFSVAAFIADHHLRGRRCCHLASVVNRRRYPSPGEDNTCPHPAVCRPARRTSPTSHLCLLTNHRRRCRSPSTTTTVRQPPAARRSSSLPFADRCQEENSREPSSGTSPTAVSSPSSTCSLHQRLVHHHPPAYRLAQPSPITTRPPYHHHRSLSIITVHHHQPPTLAAAEEEVGTAPPIIYPSSTVAGDITCPHHLSPSTA
ncbi:hypothetical protein Dimus_033787, partial [Dionaea muscipula]